MGLRPVANKGRTMSVSPTGVAPGDLIGGEAGGIIDWPVDASGNTYREIEIRVVGDAVYWMTGPASMVIGDVISKSDAAQGHSSMVGSNEIRPFQSPAQESHTKLGLKCNAGEAAIVTIQPSVPK